MGFLNYTLDDFELHVGTLVLNKRCVELTISPGISEPEDYLTWKGSFKVRRTREAIAIGLTDADFSDRATWGKGQEPVELWLNGEKVATLRIDDYYWDAQTQTGEGKLIQLLDLLAQERPSEVVDEITLGTGTTIKEVIQALLRKAGTIGGNPIVTDSQIDLSGAPASLMRDRLSMPLTSESPIKDAQELAGKYYCWLCVDADEVIRIKQRPETQGNPLFYRSDRQVESEPNPANRNFAASAVIRTGSKQSTKPNYDFEDLEPEPEPTPDDLNREEYTDEQGRPRKVVTLSQELGYDIFPADYESNSTELITSERKTIYYFYFDDDPAEIRLDSFNFQLEFPNDKILGDVERELYRIYLEREDQVRLAEAAGREPDPKVGEDSICSMVVREQPRGKVFQGIRALDYNKLYLEIAEVSIETDNEKISFQPRAINDKRSTFPQYLIVSKREKVKEGTTRPLVYKQTIRDPITGSNAEFEDPPDPEPPQPRSTFEVVTTTFRSEVILKPLSYSEYLPQSDIADIGVATSQEQLDEFTRRTAYREIQRRDSRLFQMPLPPEYLASGLEPFPIAHISDGAYIIEQPAIDITPTRASLTFQGDRIGSLQYPIPRLPDPKPIPYTTGLFIAVPRNVWAIVGEAIAPIQLLAKNGTAPYTFTGTVPSGFSLSASGLITGTATGRTNNGTVITVTDDDGATATTTVYFVAVAPQPAILEYGEDVTFDFALEIDFNTTQARPGAIFDSELTLAFSFTVDNGDTTGGGGGYG